MIVDKGEIGIGLNSGKLETDISSFLTESAKNQLSSLNGNKFLILGAHGSHTLEGDDKSNTFFGTKFDDTLMGYTSEISSDLSASGDFDNDLAKDLGDKLLGYGGNDILAGGNGYNNLIRNMTIIRHLPL